MDWFTTIFAGSGLITLVSIACTCLISLVVLGATGFVFYRVFKGMSQNSNVVKTGVSAPAVILLQLRQEKWASYGELARGIEAAGQTDPAAPRRRVSGRKRGCCRADAYSAGARSSCCNSESVR